MAKLSDVAGVVEISCGQGGYDSQGVLGGQVGQGSQKVRVFWIV